MKKNNLITGERNVAVRKKGYINCTLTVQPGAQDDYRSVFLHEAKVPGTRGYRRMPMHALSHTCCLQQ